MKWQSWTFTLLDTGFFRDGQPYNAGEGGYSRVVSGFPPSMNTIQGVVRTALATAAGWRPATPEEKWPSFLGDADSLGRLTLRGPYVVVQEANVLFPMPLCLLVRERPGRNVLDFARLEPGAPVACDLGLGVRLPRVKAVREFTGGRAPEELYVDRAGLAEVLAGNVPSGDQVRRQKEIWLEEPRTGLERNGSTRTALEGHLYQVVHVRPQKNVALRIFVSGIPEGQSFKPPRVFALGGEGRLAGIHTEDVTAEQVAAILPKVPRLTPAPDGSVRFTVTLITPGRFADTAEAIVKGPPGVPGKCISACVGRVRRIGGWDLRNHRPRPLESFLPAGSTWFFEAAAGELPAVESLHGECLGEKTEYGYGQVVIGRW
ncbi:MAG: type III-B CRISPR module-associated Cmr3 family protein [Bacillota bacterium]